MFYIDNNNYLPDEKTEFINNDVLGYVLYAVNNNNLVFDKDVRYERSTGSFLYVDDTVDKVTFEKNLIVKDNIVDNPVIYVASNSIMSVGNKLVIKNNKDALGVAIKRIDKATSKGVVTKNFCARNKSRLTKKVNEMK